MKYLVTLSLAQDAEFSLLSKYHDEEAEKVYQQYKEGALSAIYLTEETKSAILLIEVPDKQQAMEAIQSLPYVIHGVLDATIATLQNWNGLAEQLQKHKEEYPAWWIQD